MKLTCFSIMLLPLAAVFTASSAQAMDCGAVLDQLTKAVSGHLTMSPERKAAMFRMATSSYDACMAGDATGADRTREMIMTQLRQSLGGR